MSWLHFRSEHPWEWRNGVIGAAGSIFLGLCFLILMIGGLYEVSFDRPFRFHHRPQPNDAVIIYVDEASSTFFRQPWKSEAWDRKIHAELIRKLTAWGAKAIVFDILWDDPQGTNDEQLASAMRVNGKVLVASSSKSKGGETLVGGEERRPVEPIRSASRYGIVEFPAGIPPTGTDRVIRRQYSHPDYTNLAWKAAELIGQAPGERLRMRWLNYYGPPKSLSSYSYMQLFDLKSAPTDSLSNRVVFVGMESTITQGGTSSDEWETPYTGWTRTLSPGVELQATAFLNLIHREWLSELNKWVEIAIVVVIGALCGFALILLRPWVAAAVSVAGFGVIAIVAILLVWHFRLWFPWMIPCVVQIPVALSWAVLVNTRKVYHEKEVLEHSVATAKAAAASASGHPDTSSGPIAALSVINEAARTAAMTEAPTVIAPDAATTRIDSRSIGDHELIRPIGKGAYGEVWLGRSLVGILRAVKVIYRRNFEHAAPFEREFRGLKKFAPVSMSHRGFVQILHVGKNDTEGYFYYIMELGDDENSGQKIDTENYSARNLGKELRKRGNLSIAECVSIGIELAAALDCLHQHDLIHRDIKPSNIIFVNGVAKLADIGLVTEIKTIPSDATYVGTPGYIAPEGPGSKAADIFSLGKVLYECSMGRSSQDYPDLPSSLLERPEKEALLELNDLISKACDPDPKARYAAAGVLREELVKFEARIKTVGARMGDGS